MKFYNQHKRMRASVNRDKLLSHRHLLSRYFSMSFVVAQQIVQNQAPALLFSRRTALISFFAAFSSRSSIYIFHYLHKFIKIIEAKLHNT